MSGLIKTYFLKISEDGSDIIEFAAVHNWACNLYIRTFFHVDCTLLLPASHQHEPYCLYNISFIYVFENNPYNIFVCLLFLLLCCMSCLNVTKQYFDWKALSEDIFL